MSRATMEHIFRAGDRVRVAAAHRWMPERQGTIKEVQKRAGNRFLVKFDAYELGLWHDDDGDPVLRLGEKDLLPVDERLSRAA